MLPVPIRRNYCEAVHWLTIGHAGRYTSMISFDFSSTMPSILLQ
jgi:hypothetical protein